ncbi:hypothetical protein TNIN_492171 [Trichonephila inaurata madagascariensis]|uniref:Uncharacterized protein n=1 Tax=Trichonephila inaurata madagascariensis TaxID=2747483 RepID=A0A8X6IWQ6_9ARAC|nr:hypothetical protein TNIN_492171 [Trichonephila inaurata madagascariensis]
MDELSPQLHKENTPIRLRTIIQVLHVSLNQLSRKQSTFLRVLEGSQQYTTPHDFRHVGGTKAPLLPPPFIIAMTSHIGKGEPTDSGDVIVEIPTKIAHEFSLEGGSHWCECANWSS